MVLSNACMLNMDLITRPIPPIQPPILSPRSSWIDLPTYTEAITFDQGITTQARIAPGTQNVLHHIDYSSDSEEARICFELESPTRRVRSRGRYERHLRRSRRRDSPDNGGIAHFHYYQGNINVEQPPWMTKTSQMPRSHVRTRQTLRGVMEVPLEMKMIHHPEEDILVEINHLIIKDLKFLKEENLEDHLMEILEVMDPQEMEDIPQEEIHLEEEDHQDHQEENHLVPLETLDLQEIKVPLDPEATEDP